MKKLLTILALVFTVSVFSAPAYSGSGGSYDKKYEHSYKKAKKDKKHKKHKKVKFDKPKKVEKVPEIDGGHAGLALALLAGMIAVARERRKRTA